MIVEPGSAADANGNYSTSALKPILVYDGECAFCLYWVNKWKQITAEEVDYTPFQQVPPVYFGVSREQFQKSVYLITYYRRLYGAEAVFELLSIGGNNTWLQLYHGIPFADSLFELGYRIVADNRNFFYKILKFFIPDA
ncbi:thiol-disulfide oxidoreductase DCC family protein [Pontibacter sp. MBLB2868]|uniref:thiol-disulfide oxidoreductase DCC family protein n=1 Tax=Pontibacter sp. MBLB2868 TaxID=3451555 RepID=UPI003F752ADB